MGGMTYPETVNPAAVPEVCCPPRGAGRVGGG